MTLVQSVHLSYIVPSSQVIVSALPEMTKLEAKTGYTSVTLAPNAYTPAPPAFPQVAKS